MIASPVDQRSARPAYADFVERSGFPFGAGANKDGIVLKKPPRVGRYEEMFPKVVRPKHARQDAANTLPNFDCCVDQPEE
jgi:hypothetical protein